MKGFSTMADNTQSIWLIRHGETEWSRTGQHTGTTDLPLTDAGRKKATLLRPALAKQSFALVLSSPLQRARETCRIAGLEAVAKIDPDLTEWNYGEYEGLTSKQVHETRPGWMVFTDGCPGGETPDQVGIRVDRVIAKARSAPGDVALFAHGHLLRVLAARWVELPPSAGRHFLLDTGTISILSYYQTSPAIKVWNAPLA